MKSLLLAASIFLAIPSVHAEETSDPGTYDFYAAEQQAAKGVPKSACPVNVPCIIRPIKSTECNSVTGCSKCVKGPVPGEIPEYDGHCE